jgi:hypothetical protein
MMMAVVLVEIPTEKELEHGWQRFGGRSKDRGGLHRGAGTAAGGAVALLRDGWVPKEQF